MTGPELRALLKQLGLRQVALAERMGVSPVTVYRWLTGELAVPQYVVAYLGVISARPEPKRPGR
jgi:transcriptional regulator with XRE-family HTH domain